MGNSLLQAEFHDRFPGENLANSTIWKDGFTLARAGRFRNLQGVTALARVSKKCPDPDSVRMRYGPLSCRNLAGSLRGPKDLSFNKKRLRSPSRG